MDRIILDINEAYYTAYRECHNREMWDEDQYAIIEEAEKIADKEIKQLKSDKVFLVEAMIRIRPKASWFMVEIIDDTLKQIGENND